MPLQPHELRLLRRPVLRDMPMLPRQADPKTGVVDLGSLTLTLALAPT